MIKKAIKMEPGYIKTGFVNTIGSYMKMAYKTWNREHFVSDDIIISDLAVMSANKLSVGDDHTIQVVTKSSAPSNVNTFKQGRMKSRPPQNKNYQNKNQTYNKNRGK